MPPKIQNCIIVFVFYQPVTRSEWEMFHVNPHQCLDVFLVIAVDYSSGDSCDVWQAEERKFVQYKEICKVECWLQYVSALCTFLPNERPVLLGL